jgi:predicted glycoside hydrolase/deacetylase ChbG (UPF0249 family)
MNIPNNIIANADDFGSNASVNRAIVCCFEKGYINSTSLMTNMPGFEEAIELIHSKPFIKNIGVHINLAEGKPLTDIKSDYLNQEGNWDVYKTNRARNRPDAPGKSELLREINAQIDKALSRKVPISHVDSHLHLHTLPGFFKLFVTAAKQHNLRLRLAQTYNEGNYLKYYYRRYINSIIRKNKLNYTDKFETIERCLQYYNRPNPGCEVEIMLHPDLDKSGGLTDNYDPLSFKKWVDYLEIG